MNDLQTLSAAEVAKLVGVSERTLENWRRDGTGPRFVKAGRTPRYRPEALREWYAAQEREAS